MFCATFFGYRVSIPDDALSRPEVVDNPQPSTLPLSSKGPPELPYATRTRHDRADFRIAGKCRLQLEILLIGQIIEDEPGKQRRLDEREHAAEYTAVTDVALEV